MAEENSNTPISDLDAVNPQDFQPKGLPEPPVDLELEAYLGDMGLSDDPSAGGMVPEIIPGSPESIRASMFDLQTTDLGVADDPFKMGKTVMGDFRDYHNQNLFHERYSSHSEFENLGFSPFRDNETLYNENSNFFEETGRATGEWASLISLGFADAAGWSTGTDRENAEAMERSMAIGSSSKGGFTGFTTNLYLNSGYTVGIMAELAVEEIALLAAEAALGIGTVATGGAAAPVLAANTVLMGARATRAAGKIGKAWKAAYSLNKQLSNLKDIGKARSFWNKTGNKALNFVKPFENTGDFLRNMDKVSHLNNWKKTYKGFAEFYKDARNIRLAFGEGGLEGGMVQNQMERELYADFKNENGREPNEAEGLKIQQTASQAGLTTTYINAPVIMLSNKIVLGGLLGRGRFKNLYADVIDTGLDGKMLFKPGVKGAKAYTKLSKGLKGKWQYIKSPRMWAGGAAKYGKANFAEGLQEVAQETITSASDEYYTSQYQGDPVRGGYMASIAQGLTKQVGGQGLETFMSGFLMGGIVSPLSTGVGNIVQAAGGNTTGIMESRAGKIGTAIGNQYTKKFKGEEAYNTRVGAQKDTVEKRKERLDADIEMLNEFYEDPTKYFSGELENLVAQKTYKEAIDLAEKNGDKRIYHDLKDSSTTKHITTALKYGRLDGFITRMEEQKQFTKEEFKGVDTELSQEDFNTKIDASIDRAKQVQRSWDMVSKKYPNPFSPEKFRPGTDRYTQEATSQKAWEQTIEEMVFNQETFVRTLERQQSILNEARTIAGLKNMSTTDLNVLFTEDDVMQEIELLKTELQGSKDSAGLEDAEALTAPMRKMVKQKKAKLEALEKYDAALKAFEDDKGVEKEDKDPKTIAALRKAYKSYMQTMAEQSGDFLNVDNLDNSFEALVDYHTLGTRTAASNDAVNRMLDPKNFKRGVERRAGVMDILRANREVEIRKSLEEYRRLKDQNTMLNRLYDEGMFFDPKELIALQEEGTIPKNFYYVETSKEHKSGEVVKTSADYAIAIGVVTKEMKKMGIDVEDIIIMEETDPYSTKSRMKNRGDNRRYEDLATQFGFDSTKDSSEVPLKQVLEAVMKSEYASEHEKALAEQLLKKADDLEFITFSRSEKIPSAFTSAGAVVDARYSSDEYHQGRNGNPIEHIILHTEVLRRVFKSTQTDTDFKTNMNLLMAEALQAYSSMSADAQATIDIRFFLDVNAFMAGAMSNANFQEFLATVQTKVKTTESVWKRFVDAVLAKLKGALGSNGTVLNAALDLITAKIEVIGVAPAATTATTSSVKKADIEKRKQEELDEKAINELNDSLGDGFTIKYKKESIEGAAFNSIDIFKDGEKVGNIKLKKDANNNVAVTFMFVNENSRRKGIAESFYKELNKSLIKNKKGVLHSDTTFLGEGQLEDLLNDEYKDDTEIYKLDGKEITKDEYLALGDRADFLELVESNRIVVEVVEVDAYNNKSAEKLWIKLVEKGVAEKIPNSEGYRFKSEQQAPTKSTGETVNVIDNTLAPSELKTDHPYLWQSLVDIFIAENVRRADSKSQGALLIGFDTMTHAEIGKSDEFAKFIKGGHPEVNSAFYSYNKAKIDTTQSVPLGSTEEVSAEEIAHFKATGKVSRARVIKIGNKLESGGETTLTEEMFLANDAVKAEVGEYRTKLGKKVPTVLTTDMKKALSELGFPTEKIRELNSSVQTAWRYINEGLTWDERTSTAKAAAAAPSPFNEEGEAFHIEVGMIVDGIYNMKSYRDAEKELMDMVKTRGKEMKNAQLTVEDFQNWMGEALGRLAFNFTFEELEAGEIVMLVDSDIYWRVVQVGKSGLILEPDNKANKGDPIQLSKKEAIDKIEYRYSEAMADPEIKLDESEPITEEEEVLVEETMTATSDINSNKAIKEDLKKAGTMTSAERMEAIKNNKNCK